MRAILLAACGWMLAGMAAAGDLPVAPPSPMVDPFPEGTLAKMPVAQNFAFGGAGFALGRTAVAPVIKRFGAGQVQTLASNGGDEIKYVCYDLPQNQQRVWLAMTDTTGDGVSIDTVTVKHLDADDPKTSRCATLPSQYQPLRIDGAIGIGTTRRALVQRLGAPALEAGGWLVFKSVGGSKRQSVTVRLAGDKVVFIYADNSSTD